MLKLSGARTGTSVRCSRNCRSKTHSNQLRATGPSSAALGHVGDHHWTWANARIAADLRGQVPACDLVPGEPEPGIRRLRALPSAALARAQHPAWIAMAADNYWRMKVRWVTPLELVTAS